MNDRWLWTFPVLGGIFILLALLLQIHRWNAEEQMLRTTGEVVAVMGRGCPVVEFSPRQSELTRFTGEVCSRPGYAMGEVVDLFYDPLEPENAHIDSFVQNWFISLILGAVGLFFCLVGSFLLMPDSFSNRRLNRLKGKAQAVQAKFVDVRRNPFPHSTMYQPGNLSVSGTTRRAGPCTCSIAKISGSTPDRSSRTSACRS